MKGRLIGGPERESNSETNTINYDTDVLHEMFQLVSFDEKERRE